MLYVLLLQYFKNQISLYLYSISKMPRLFSNGSVKYGQIRERQMNRHPFLQFSHPINERTFELWTNIWFLMPTYNTVFSVEYWFDSTTIWSRGQDSTTKPSWHRNILIKNGHVNEKEQWTMTKRTMTQLPNLNFIGNSKERNKLLVNLWYFNNKKLFYGG